MSEIMVIETPTPPLQTQSTAQLAPPRPDRATPRYLKWLMIIGVIIVALLVVGIVGYVIAMSSRQVTLQANQGKWAANGSWNYMLVVRMGGGTAGVAQNTVIVRLGRVVGQTGFHCVQECNEAAFAGAMGSVEGLFKTVNECNRDVFSCLVEYDDYFGYPRTIDYQCYGPCTIGYTEVLGLYLGGGDRSP